MKLHARAALTLKQLEELARLVVEDGWTFRAAAERFRVMPNTASNWVRRYRETAWKVFATIPAGPRDKRARHRPRWSYSSGGATPETTVLRIPQHTTGTARRVILRNTQADPNQVRYAWKLTPPVPMSTNWQVTRLGPVAGGSVKIANLENCEWCYFRVTLTDDQADALNAWLATTGLVRGFESGIDYPFQFA